MQTSFQRPASLYYWNPVRYDPFDWLAEKGLPVKHTQPGGKKLRDQKVPIAVVLGSYPNIYHSSRQTAKHCCSRRTVRKDPEGRNPFMYLLS
jgi:hypothetical protein